MRAVFRSTRVLLLGIFGAVVLAFASALVSVVALASTVALVMGGTANPLRVPQQNQNFVDFYVGSANERYINHTSPSNCDTTGPAFECRLLGAVTPEEFVPVFGQLTFNRSVALGRQMLDNCITGGNCEFTHLFSNGGTVSETLPDHPYDIYRVFGFSQSATIVTLEKRHLAATYAEGEGPKVAFTVIGNPDRPHGGFLSSFIEGFTIPFLDVTFFGPTPTDTQYESEDYSRQYDGWSDGPTNPLNLIADLNALIGIGVLHGDYMSNRVGEPVLQDQYGDTTYYLIPTKFLPLISWLDYIPVAGAFVANILDAPLRVIVEAAYDRTTSPGQPTGWNPFYIPNPILFAINFVISMPTGWDNALSEATGLPWLRPFFTTPAGPYGVGGPPVTMSPTTNEHSESLNPPAGAEAAAVATDLDRSTAGAADDVRETPVAHQPPAADALRPEAPAVDTDTEAPDAATPDTETPPATTPGRDPVTAPSAQEPSRPKVRHPIGADRPGRNDATSSHSRRADEPTEQAPATADGDAAPQPADNSAGSDPSPTEGKAGDDQNVSPIGAAGAHTRNG